MKNSLKISLVALCLSGFANAESPRNAASRPEVAPSQSGMARMTAIMDGVAKKNTDGELGEATQNAIASGKQSAAVSADLNHMDAKTVDFSMQQAQNWEKIAREAYVAALPPRDRALGASVLLGDSSGGPGRMYIFVSRSMSQSLLRAYAVDAFYLGASLVVKGVRKGDTLKEYLAEAMENFNSVDGMTMAAMEINPNLFDMFDIKVVPTVVWTNRIGLDDVGSGCQNQPDDAPVEKLTLTGPDDEAITVDKPSCAKLPETTYYKLSGALAMPYVLDRFQEAGLPKQKAEGYRAKLAERTSNVHDGSVRQTTGNAIAPLTTEVKLDQWPKPVLKNLKQRLATSNVMRGPFGPVFSPDAEDDAAYREELDKKIRHGLGL